MREIEKNTQRSRRRLGPAQKPDENAKGTETECACQKRCKIAEAALQIKPDSSQDMQKKRGENNHALWPKMREKDLLKFLAAHSLSVGE